MKNYINMLSAMLTLTASGIEKVYAMHVNSNGKDILPCENVLTFRVCNTMERQKVIKKEVYHGGKITG